MVASTIYANIIRYYFHLINSNSDILSAALTTNYVLSQLGVKCWYYGFERIIKFAGLEHLLYTLDGIEIKHQLHALGSILKSKYLEAWKSTKNKLVAKGTSKIGLLLSIKDKLSLAEYLNIIKEPKHRIALSKLRLSSHRFPIESGRYEQVAR